MAKLWDVPCVFVCENNKYGMGISTERSSSNTKYFTCGDKISGIQVNGMDIITSAQAVKHTHEWVLLGKGPLLLEFVTYCYGSHSCVFSALCYLIILGDPFNLAPFLVTLDISYRSDISYVYSHVSLTGLLYTLLVLRYLLNILGNNICLGEI